METAATSNESPVSLRQMMPVIGASTLGTAIEWYDFFLYGTVSALVFPALFFPKSSPLAGLILAFTTNLVGFVARPIGGAIFGHLGDRVGRKSTLIATLLLMGISTFLIGFMPGYTSIGVAAPLLVSLLRFCQGLGVGGEWGGSVLLALEYGHQRNRGFWASWPQMGVPIGLVLSAAAVAIFAAISGSQFGAWGWRIPFFLSALLIVVCLYIRIRILETPLFSKIKEEKKEAKFPVGEVIARNWPQILLTAGARFVEQAPFYLFTTFVVAYGTKTLGMGEQVILAGTYIAAIVELFTIPLFSSLSDRFSRKRWYLIGCVIMVVFAFPYFLLLNTKSPVLVIISIVISLALCHAWVYGPQAALISENFGTKLRYSGASLGYQLAAPFAGGLAPIIAAALLAWMHTSTLISVYIVLLGIISFISVFFLRDLTHANIADEVYMM
ncbi:MAG TPA: MFS transporter [Ktedonobacteraceae bacterium]